MNYKTMKVFDCQSGMPPDVKKAFFDVFREQAKNDVYVSHEINCNEYIDEADEYDKKFIKNIKVLDEWLIENGAIKNETVLINHWW